MFRGIVRDLRACGVDQLGLFFMNEPFLCDWLPDAIAWAKRDAGVPYVFLTTNGVAATEEHVRACMAAGLDSLKFALNFADPSQMAMASGHGEEFEAVVVHAAAARRGRDELNARTGHDCRLSASSLLYDAEQRSRMRPLLERIGGMFDEHYWLPLYGRRADAPTGALAGVDEVACKPVPCWTLFTEAHVRADGCLVACGLDASDRFVVADLARTAFAKAWHSDAFRALRSRHLDANLLGTACESCVASDAIGDSMPCRS